MQESKLKSYSKRKGFHIENESAVLDFCSDSCKNHFKNKPEMYLVE